MTERKQIKIIRIMVVFQNLYALLLRQFFFFHATSKTCNIRIWIMSYV